MNDQPDLLGALDKAVQRAREAHHDAADRDVKDWDPWADAEVPPVPDGPPPERREPPRPAPAARPAPVRRRRRPRAGLSQVEKVRRVACPTERFGMTGCGAEVGAKCREADGAEREANHAVRVKAHKIAFPRHESMNAAGGEARDHYGRTLTGPSGARYGGTCDRCGEDLSVGSAGIVQRKGKWIHRDCAPGADDE